MSAPFLTQAQFSAGPPQGKLAPLGGSEPHAMGSVGAFIFDMDGTMIDSMPSHKHSWVEFARRKQLQVDIDDLMRRTTGRTGIECMRLLFDHEEMDDAEALAHVQEKEAVYREIFSPIFAEVAGFITSIWLPLSTRARSRPLVLSGRS